VFEPKVVILFSGGADSVLLLHFALELRLHPYCVLIDYEQNHKIELNFARSYLKEKCIPSQTVKIHRLGVRSGLTTGETSIYSEVNEMYVPSRNLMFVSIAAGIAESLKVDTIWYGANCSDVDNGFPDCTANWVRKVNALLKINGSVKIKLEAPLLEQGATKEDVMRGLNLRHVNMGKIFSGYMEDNHGK
jgi:7-cyano-7-deazaguanine synthase